MKMPFFTLFVLFVIWFTIKLKLSYKENRKSKEAFIERETAANNTRKQSLDDLDYITIPLSKLPFYDETDKEISQIQETIKSLSNKKIVNLTGISNTDLKLTYGAANLNDLTEFDRNFTELARTLNKWGKLLYENNRISDARTVLEFAVSAKTDISGTYTLLADIYSSTGDESHIHELINEANKLESLTKNSIIRKLNDVLHQSGHNFE